MIYLMIFLVMLPAEVERMRKAESETPHEATWTPVLWALKLLERARTEGKIKVYKLFRCFFLCTLLILKSLD